MYVVIHGDPTRGAAIVQALGGKDQATLVERAGGAIRLAMDGVKLDAILASPEAVDTFFFSGDFRAEKALQGVPVLFDGGKAGPLYRAFSQSHQAGRSFRFLRGASPGQAAEALRRLEPQPEPPPPHRRAGWWIELLVWLPAMVVLLTDLARPGTLPAPALPLIMGLWLMHMPWRSWGGPMLGAVRRGLRPTVGAMLGSLMLVPAVAIFASGVLQAWRGG